MSDGMCIHLLDPRSCDECADRLDAPGRLERAAWLMREGRVHEAADIVEQEAAAIRQAKDPTATLMQLVGRRRRR